MTEDRRQRTEGMEHGVEGLRRRAQGPRLKKTIPLLFAMRLALCALLQTGIMND